MEENLTAPGRKFAGRYTIERELGRGGAAVVYLAADDRQERRVALKVLHRELAQAIGAQRFLREIKHSSSLHHPHLLAIHESGESDGLLYYVMPYMSDGSLRSRIAKEKQLPIDEAIRITRHVGEALAYAHSRGIVHRDIKPDNVLFSAEHACLADFGIARAVDSVAADTLTSTGLVVGTPAYMSPEQASGEKDVDARSDQYSLACLLYEMITGLPPFIGATAQSVISQRFTQPPPSMRVHRPTVPDHVERAVKRALAVIPADRFPGVAEFVAALHDPDAVPAPESSVRSRKRWLMLGGAAALVTTAAVGAGPGVDWARATWGTQVDTTKFVVLPFLSEADSAAGARVTSAVRSGLERWDGLALEEELTMRDAVREYGPVRKLGDAYSIARALGAGRLIWGHVARDGDRTTVYASVYDVAARRPLGERRVSVSGGGDSALVELASALIAGAPVPRGMDGGESGTTEYAAWQAYRRGIAALGAWKLAEADQHLARAVASDPDFAVAQYWHARVASWLRRENSRTWTANAARAVALKSELTGGDAMRAEALLAMGNGNHQVACERYRQLAARDTLDAGAWHGLGECLHADEVVLRDASAPHGYRFRSSWHAAGMAFTRALEIEPLMHAIPQFRRLRQLFPTESSRLRSGQLAGSGGQSFAAYPQLIADTLAFVPVPSATFGERERTAAEVSRQSQALARNRRIMRSLAETWATKYPESQEAHLSLASVLEVGTELDAALASLTRARRLPASELDGLSAADAEARVRLKLGDFAGARRVADSVLSRAAISELSWEPLARLAGLTGNVGKLAESLRYYWPKYAGAEDVEPQVAARAGELLAHAALGACHEKMSSLRQAVDASIRSRVQPDRHDDIRQRVANAPATYLMHCTGGRSMADVDPGADMIMIAQSALARGDAAGARRALIGIAQGRAQRRPGDISVNLVSREARLRMAMGDTASAVAILDAMLGALPTISAAVLSHPLENAVLVSTMALRADVAAARRDATTAAKWGTAAAEVWGGASAELRPTVERMRRLTSGR
jgi:tRNA A-37 threonylcarbamoyl transferase component Bud32/tetratricopeptide (TPR) repeat protein